MVILKFDLLFFPSVLAHALLRKWVSEEELSPVWEADRRELGHVLASFGARSRAAEGLPIRLTPGRRVPGSQGWLQTQRHFSLEVGRPLCLVPGSQVSTASCWPAGSLAERQTGHLAPREQEDWPFPEGGL